MSDSDVFTRRDVLATAALAGAAAIGASGASNGSVGYGIIGVGGRGAYLLKHLQGIGTGRCVAVCDLDAGKTEAGAELIGANPVKYQDYRALLDNRNVEAVIIAVPLFEHYAVTRDALLAGKHVLCEKSLVFQPFEVHALRALAAQHQRQVLQVGLQRRYSRFYQIAKAMVDKGLLGNVTHVHAQWHRNPGWVMRGFNWRLYREYSGGLTAELASHQIDIADWMFGATPEYVIGVGGLDTWKDGRDVYDNIQLIYKYPNNQKLVYSSITTNSHMPYLGATRPEFGEIIMGTGGSLEITVGDGEQHLATALYYRETTRVVSSPPPLPGEKEPAAPAGATYFIGGGQRGMPLAVASGELDIAKDDSFLSRELKYSRRWLYSKGVIVDDEDTNPVEMELRSFFDICRNGGKPRADIEVGLNDSIAVILSNLAMRDERRVYFNEIDKMGSDENEADFLARVAKSQDSYKRSLAARKKMDAA
jgi:predicted dehydrogenase